MVCNLQTPAILLLFMFPDRLGTCIAYAGLLLHICFAHTISAGCSHKTDCTPAHVQMQHAVSCHDVPLTQPLPFTAAT